MNLLNRLTIKAKLYLLVSIFICGLIIYGLLTYFTIQSVKINSSYYKQIVLGKDLIADILPPPEYILESYLLVFQQLSAENKEELNALVQRTKALHEEYMSRHEFWATSLPAGPLRDALIVQSYLPANDFFNVWENQFLPALQSDNHKKALDLLNGPLKQLYTQHLKAIHDVITLAQKHNEEIEKEADDIYRTSTTIAFIAWILTILIGLILAFMIGRSITGRLNDTIQNIGSISDRINNKMDLQGQNVIQQSTSVHETTTTMDELNTSFQHTASLAADSSDRAKNALQVSEEGNTRLHQMLDGLLSHKNKVEEIVLQIMKLSELTRQIHNIATVTSNLTNQTNILALNAAVQAAHVKQQSEGFSVIASEIRKLADESKKFLTHIDVLSENIQQATDSTVTIAQEGSKTVQESIQLAQATLNTFEQIKRIVNNSFEGAEQVSLNVKQQASAVTQVLKAMELLTEASEQTVSATKEVKGDLDKLNQVSSELSIVI